MWRKLISFRRSTNKSYGWLGWQGRLHLTRVDDKSAVLVDAAKH